MPSRLISLLLLFPLVLSFAPLSASAVSTTPECEAGFERIAQMVRSERRRGVDQEWLVEMNELLPFLVDCVSASPDGEIGAGPAQWGPLVAAYFRIEDVPRALCLMGHESRGDPRAINPTSGASGLMQVMPFWAARFGYSAADLLDPMVNLEIAAWIRDYQGWTAWSPYKRGLCR